MSVSSSSDPDVLTDPLEASQLSPVAGSQTFTCVCSRAMVSFFCVECLFFPAIVHLFRQAAWIMSLRASRRLCVVGKQKPSSECKRSPQSSPRLSSVATKNWSILSRKRGSGYFLHRRVIADLMAAMRQGATCSEAEEDPEEAICKGGRYGR